jgi:hypothetical protein
MTEPKTVAAPRCTEQQLVGNLSEAREIIEEIEREIYWSKRRSGEGR